MLARGRNKQHRKQDYVHLPALDAFLTVGTAVLFVAWIGFLSSHDSVGGLVEFAGWTMVTVVAIYGSKALCLFVGPTIGMPAAVSKQRNLRKFADQGWQLVVHSAMTAMELYILSGANFWTSTTTIWTDPVDPLTHRFYKMQLAIWFFTAFSHRFLEARHKDYYLMYGHHFVTIFLCAGSYFSGALNVGLFVLFLHDAPDVVADLVKMANYLGLDEKSGTYIVEILFASNLVTWLLFRLYWFPRVVIYSAWFESSLLWSEQEPGLLATMETWEQPDGGSLQLVGRGAEVLADGYLPTNLLRVGLCVLLVMHAYWYYMFLRILWKLVSGTNAHDAGREDYEGASSDSDAAKDN